jgi:prolyl-tRNA synthetase
VSPLALDENTFPRVVTVLDAALASSTELFAVRAQAADATVFLKGTEIAAYLKHLEKEELVVHEVDFAALAADAPAAAAGAGAGAGNAAAANARIEGAVQIAVGVKKEVDFPQWYTNVSAARSALRVVGRRR